MELLEVLAFVFVAAAFAVFGSAAAVVAGFVGVGVAAAVSGGFIPAASCLRFLDLSSALALAASAADILGGSEAFAFLAAAAEASEEPEEGEERFLLDDAEPGAAFNVRAVSIHASMSSLISCLMRGPLSLLQTSCFLRVPMHLPMPLSEMPSSLMGKFLSERSRWRRMAKEPEPEV